MRAENKLLTILSDAEQEALYGLPDFDDAQRLEYLALTEAELTLASSRPGLHAQCQQGQLRLLHWFGLRFEPRFTDLNDQLKELYCADDPAQYEKCLIRPAGKIDCDLIIKEKPNIDQIVATLGLKEMTQGTLIRKLCTYTTTNPTRRAVFEFDKLIRSIYTLRYLRDPQLERNVHRSQNRIESYQ